MGDNRSGAWRGFSATPELVTHADGSRVSIAIIRVCDSVILCECVSVRTIKPKTLETKIARLDTGIVHRDIRSKVKVLVRFRRSSGRRELCISMIHRVLLWFSLNQPGLIIVHCLMQCS